MTPFEQDQLLDQVRANGNWVEPMENGLTLDGHLQLADLRKLVLVLKARLNSAYSLSSANSLSLDPYPEELDDLKKLLVKIDATEDPVAYGNWLHQLVEKSDAGKPYRDLAEHFSAFSKPPAPIQLPISKVTFAEIAYWHGYPAEFEKACRQELYKANIRVDGDSEFYVFRQVDPYNPAEPASYYIQVSPKAKPRSPDGEKL